MARILSGAAGLLGANLAWHLSRQGERPRLLLGPSADLSGLHGMGADEVEADAGAPETLRPALEGVEQVVHFVRLSQPSSLADVERELLVARNLLAAAAAAKVRRAVLVTSSASLGGGPLDAPASEEDGGAPRALGRVGRALGRIELAAVEAAGDSVELVIAHPALSFGAHGHDSGSARLLAAVASGLVRAYPSGGASFANAEDVAAGLAGILAAAHPSPRYALGGEDLTWRALLTICAEELGVRPPAVRAPDALVRGVSRLWSKALGRAPALGRAVDPEALAGLTDAAYVSSSRALRELGYRPRPVRIGIRAACRWLQDEGVLRRDRPLTPRGAIG